MLLMQQNIYGWDGRTHILILFWSVVISVTLTN